jgi:hypothetical protein
MLYNAKIEFWLVLIIELCANYRMSGIMFDQSPFAIYWSVRNFKKPNEVNIKSNRLYWFDCPDCNHTFERKPCDIKNTLCNYCAGRLLCNDNNCEYCFSMSFASSHCIIMLDANNAINPREVFNHSRKKYNFTCNMCNFAFRTSPNALSPEKIIGVSGCPICL